MQVIKAILKPLASLKLTVVLMALSMLLIFCATWAQIDKGIWAIVHEYFRSFVVWVPFQIFLPRDKAVMGGFPLPGGYVLGPLLLVNLLSAHAVRFRMKAEGERRTFGFSLLVFGVALLAAFHVLGAPRIILAWTAERPWLPGSLAITVIGTLVYLPLIAAVYVLFEKRTGIILIHAALILLIVGEAITGAMAVETQMPIYEGQTINWVHDIREVELAVMERDKNNVDKVTAIPASHLVVTAGSQDPVIRASLPFEIRIERYFPNSRLEVRTAPANDFEGLGKILDVTGMKQVTGVGEQQVDYPAAVISLWQNGQALGKFLVSPHFNPQMVVFTLRNNPRLARQAIGAYWPGDQVSTLPQTLRIGDREYDFALRFRRHYKPYAIRLTEFRHDLYTGTQIPKNFSSEVLLLDASNTPRHVNIYMNNPLRYRGETFYQSGWLGDDFGTILQVVNNPGWQIPYIACILGGLGLLIHFGLHLGQFLKKSPVVTGS